jgi:hypothetical protein
VIVARWVERLGWVVCGLAVVFGVFAFTSKPIGDDLANYLVNAQLIVEGRSPYLIPTRGCPTPIGCLANPPPALLLFVPFLVIEMPTAESLLAAAYTCLAVAVGALLVAPLPRSLRPWTAACIALYFPLLLELNLLNTNLVTLALALTAWALRDRPGPAGVSFAAAAGLKLLGAPLTFFYAGARRWRQLASGAATLGAIGVATAPWVGGYWGDWLPTLFWRVASTDMLGIRPVGLSSTPAFLALAAAAIGVILAAGIASWHSPGRASDLHALALAATPLFATFISYPSLIMALPLFAAVTRSLAPRPLLLALPLAAWLAVEMPLGMEAWRFGGLLGIIALGAVLFLPPLTMAAPRAGI